MTGYGAARVAPEKAVFRPALPMSFQPGLNGTDTIECFGPVGSQKYDPADPLGQGI